MIVTVILVVMVGILSVAIIQVRSVFESSDLQANLQAYSRTAISNLAADLRRTNNSQISITQNSPGPGTDSITIHLPADSDANGMPDLVSDVLQWDSTDIIFSVDTGSHQLIKTINSASSVLANNVKSIRFFDHAIDNNLNLNELRAVLELEKANKEGRVYNLISTSLINMRN